MKEMFEAKMGKCGDCRNNEHKRKDVFKPNSAYRMRERERGGRGEEGERENYEIKWINV